MKKLAVAASVFILVLAYLVFVSRAFPRPAKPLPELPARLWPGQPLPPDVSCHFDMYNPVDRWCNVGDIYLETDGNKIASADVFLLHEVTSAGSLVLTWGEPQSATYNGYSAELYWKADDILPFPRYAYFYGSEHTFSPDSSIGFVVYGRGWGHGQERWRGFKDIASGY